MLVTDPRQRASLQEIIHHPWILKGFSGPPENHLPPREPLFGPLDPEIIHGMTGFEFGSSETIAAQLTKVIESEDYRIAVQTAAKETPMASPNLEKRKPFGFDFYKRRSSTSSKDTLTNLSTEVLSHPSNPDPINAYNPLISIYYLVKEKLERDQGSNKPHSSQPPLPTQDVEKLRIPIPKAPEAAYTSETSYEVKGEPISTGGRTRPRARTHGDEEVSEAMKKVNLGVSLPPSPIVPPSAIKEDNPAKKESTVGGMLRRFSTRRQHSGRGDAKAPLPPTLSVQAPGQAPVEIATPRKSLSVRRSPAERAVASSGSPQTGAPDLLTPPTTADGPNSKRSAKIGRSTSVSEADWRRKYGRQHAAGDPPGTSGSDRSGISTREDAVQSDKGTSSNTKPMTVRAKSLGHGRRENSIRRARREETTAGASVPNDVPEEDVGDGATSTGSGDGETPSSDFVKPVYLKGLFSVATTSTRPPTEIRMDIIRVLKQLGVSYKEIRGGFSCVHRPSIDLKSVQENVPQTPEATNMVNPSSHRRKLSFGGTGSGSTKEPPPPPPPMKGQNKRNRADTSYTNSDISNESMHDGVLGGSLILQFEIYIVKVPLLSLHGIQFKSVNKTNTWQYKSLASRILQELRL